MTPTSVTREVMAAEQAAITSWAARHGWRIEYDADALLGLALTEHQPPDRPGRKIAFIFDVTDYPAAPPAWWCAAPPQDDLAANLGAIVDELTNDNPQGLRRPRSVEARHFPAPAPNHPPQIAGSIFHTNPVICAPWNRLAYKVNGGPHSNWGSLTDWKSAGEGYTRAHTIADMLSALRLHLLCASEMRNA